MFDDEAVNLLKKQIEAQLAVAAEEKRKNDLAEQALKQAELDRQLRQVAERNRLKVNLDTNEKVEGLLQQLPQIFLVIHGIHEWCKEATRRLDRIDEILLIQLAGKGNGNRGRVQELKQELELEHTERLILQEHENLQELELQAAQYGIDKPIRLTNQIKKTKQKLEELERKRSKLDAGNI